MEQQPKVKIYSTKPLQLGNKPSCPVLKLGLNLIDLDQYLEVKDKWFFQPLVDNKTIRVELPPDVSADQLTEIVVEPKKAEDTASIAAIPSKAFTEVEFIPPEEKQVVNDIETEQKGLPADLGEVVQDPDPVVVKVTPSIKKKFGAKK